MKIVFFPFDGRFNKYVDLMKTAFGSFAEVLPFNLKNFFASKYFVFNWFENSRNLIAFILVILLLKITGKKIIWVMHNKIPHDSKNKFLSYLKMKIMAKSAEKIIIHSKSSAEHIKYKSKIVYIPHPNYVGVYGEIAEPKIAPNKLKLLFLGFIKPYKNIELFIDVFSELNLENAELSICGFAKENYRKKILAKIAPNKNIFPNIKFIADDEISHILAQNHILITPCNSESVLNSGSVILAFSYKRTVLSVKNGTLDDLRIIRFENKNMFFTYEYDNFAEHKKILREKILYLYENYAENYNNLLDLGEECFEAVKENNSLEKISGILKQIFKSEEK